MKQYFLAFLALLLSLPSISQDKVLKNAERAFLVGDFNTAISEYNVLMEAEQDPIVRSEYRYKIGEAYFRLSRLDRAEKSFNDAIKGGYMSPKALLSLGEVQLMQGKYDEALSSFESYKLANPGDPLSDVKIASCQFAKENSSSISLFKVERLTINSRQADFGVSFFHESLLFSSTRGGNTATEEVERDPYDDRVVPKKQKQKAYTKSGLSETKVMLSVGNAGRFNRPQEISDFKKMKNFADDGVVLYDPYSRQGLYTFQNKKKSYIQFLFIKNNKWTQGEKIEVDSKGEPIGHPHMTADGSRIYFTSTMDGGFGKSDIWYIEKVSPTSWSQPINAGENINTSGNEVYPTIAGEYMFFASDGRIGLGGLDIFASKIESGQLQRAINIGAPFNSSSDDYNLVMRSDLKEGVFVSGRDPKFNDDIYHFEGFPSYVTATGKIIDANSKKPVSNVTVNLLKDGKSLGKVTSDEHGNYLLPIIPNTRYTMKVEVAGYPSAEKTFTSPKGLFGRINKGTGVDLDFQLSGNASVISGRVVDRASAMPMVGEAVMLIAGNKIVETVKADASGIFKFSDLKSNTEYTIKTEPKGSFAQAKSIKVTDAFKKIEYSKQNGYDLDLSLDKLELRKETLITGIAFQDDRANLLSSSFKELDRLAEVFRQNPHVNIMLSGYVSLKTSSRIANELSVQRVRAIRDYLVSKKVNPAQLDTRGFGRAKPHIVRPKTDEEHEMNNRITYTVTKIDEVKQLGNSLTMGGTPTQNTGGNTRPTQPATGNNGNTRPTTPVGGNTQTPPSNATNYADLPFRVQISALKVLDLSNPTFAKIKSQLGFEVRYDLGGDGFYRYYIGGFSTRDEAADAVSKLKSIGIDSFLKPKW